MLCYRFCLGIEDIREIYSLCSESCADKWRDIGLKLGVPESKLKEIKKNSPSDCQDCLSEMFSSWLKSRNKGNFPTRKALHKVLSSIQSTVATQLLQNCTCEDKKIYDYGKTTFSYSMSSLSVIVIVN